MHTGAPRTCKKNHGTTFGGGALIGTLGGSIGLGGAEFRLPFLIGTFGFAALDAVILNKAMSLVVVSSALPFRVGTVPFGALVDHWLVILNLLSGSLLGAWVGVGWALRLKSERFYKVIALLLVGIALVLMLGHHSDGGDRPLLSGVTQAVAGTGAGFAIGVVASLLGVAGGELLIPTLVLLFGADIKLAGSLSLAISLPTMMMGLARYSTDQSFIVLRRNQKFVVTMAAGSLAGAFLGAQLLGRVPDALLLPGLAMVLVISAIKVWRHA